MPPFEVHTLNVDLQGNAAFVLLIDKSTGSQVNVSTKFPTPGDQSESQLKTGIKAHAKRLLLEAANAL